MTTFIMIRDKRLFSFRNFCRLFSLIFVIVGGYGLLKIVNLMIEMSFASAQNISPLYGPVTIDLKSLACSSSVVSINEPINITASLLSVDNNPQDKVEVESSLQYIQPGMPTTPSVFEILPSRIVTVSLEAHRIFPISWKLTIRQPGQYLWQTWASSESGKSIPRSCGITVLNIPLFTTDQLLKFCVAGLFGGFFYLFFDLGVYPELKRLGKL